ncbi:MAG: A/G-specific adenine glycosylase [Candidatus Kerfeldbacteria bacterium]|nr:A/G-specific adenine glycosylase [Candidatus Kerfeldbacteria bacterium]
MPIRQPRLSTVTVQKKQFAQRLFTWYTKHARDLPWRRTHEPYRILLSEMMLQQTQVDRVIEYYTAWLKKFPNVKALAAAPVGEVIAAWQGLGYNRRALYLHRIAKTVVSEHGGKFPRTHEGLLALPGIGPYTAGAMMSFAFRENAPILDTNVKRVLGRIFLGYKRLARSREDELWKLAGAVLPSADVYYFNQALMDFGSLVCVQRKPKCSECPFQNMCKSYPKILDAPREELRLPKVKETLYFGQPRRIWRGKILNYLHSVDTVTGATPLQIGRAIQPDFSTSRLAWLRSVIQTLEHDTLVVYKKKKIYLP